MTTPTPLPGLRAELDDLLDGLAAAQGRATRSALRSAVFTLFEVAAARPAASVAQIRGISDTNGDAPEEVERALFHEPAPAELRIMEAVNAASINGFDPGGRA